MELALLLRMIPFEVERVIFSKANALLSRRPGSAPFLSGDTFRTLADHVYDQTGEFDPRAVQFGSVVFVGVTRMAEFAGRILPALAEPIILITHQGDLNIGAEFGRLADHPMILHWFAQNCLLSHPKVTPLPIGLEDRWRHNNGAPGDFRRLSRNNMPRIPRVAYAFSLGTNIETRIACYAALKRSSVATELPQPLNSSLYRRIVRQYQFVASPQGNGVDCHRTWEVLYMGAIPIVEDNVMNRFFMGLRLPLLIVKDWSEISSWDEAGLAKKYAKLNAAADRSALFVPYWRSKFALARGPRSESISG
jgi:hypothetical protein